MAPAEAQDRHSGLPPGWHTREIPADIDLGSPGIYEWHIEGVGSYVGKSRHLNRRLREYPNNVRKMFGGLPYRAGKPQGYRQIHHALRAAIEAGHVITLTVIENCGDAELNARERYWIALRGTLNGSSGQATGPKRTRRPG